MIDPLQMLTAPGQGAAGQGMDPAAMQQVMAAIQQGLPPEQILQMLIRAGADPSLVSQLVQALSGAPAAGLPPGLLGSGTDPALGKIAGGLQGLAGGPGLGGSGGPGALPPGLLR